MAHLASSALSNIFRACLPSRLRLPSMAQISAGVSVPATGGAFGSPELFAERGQLLLPQRIRISSNVCERIVNSVGDPPAPNQLKVRRRLCLAGLNVPQSLSRRFQVVEIRLADQHGVVLASTAGNDDLTPAVARNCLEQGKKFLTSGGYSKYAWRHGISITCTSHSYMVVDSKSRGKPLRSRPARDAHFFGVCSASAIPGYFESAGTATRNTGVPCS